MAYLCIFIFKKDYTVYNSDIYTTNNIDIDIYTTDIDIYPIDTLNNYTFLYYSLFMIYCS